MDSFAFSSGLPGQGDLVLTSSVNWSGDAAQIIESAQQEFEVSDERDLCLTTADLIGTEERRSGRESWGNYFAKKSPPMGDLCGSHGVDQNTKRPLFDQNANSKQANAHTNPSKQATSDLAMISEQRNELSRRNTLGLEEEARDELGHGREEDDIGFGDEHEAMLINQSLDGQAMDGMVASKSIESSDLNLNDLEQLNPDLTDYLSGSNRDSNATHKTDMSSRRGSLNRLIQIAKLAQIQRFYQFKLDEDALHELLRQSNNGDVEEEVERLMLAFLDAFYAEPSHANLSAVTFKAAERKCTALVLFEEEADAAQTLNEEWMEHFMSFEPLSAIRDKNEEPVFTQLSA